jgi:hypothetical protein
MLGTSADPGNSGRAKRSSKDRGKSAAMPDARRGEHIARRPPRSNVRDQVGAETLEGSSRPLLICKYAWADGAERGLIETLWCRRVRRFVAGPGKHVRGDRAKFRSRPSPENPRRVKPKGVASSRRTKPSSGCQGLPKGAKPRNRGLSGRPGASAAGIPLGRMVGGFIRSQNPGYLSEGGNSEG